MQVSPAFVREGVDIEHALVAFAQQPNGGLIVLPNPVTIVHRKLIITTAAAHQLPAIYPFRFFATDGGLMSYGLDLRANFRRAAHQVDKILKGAKPGELPVEQPAKFELVINLKTAKELGLSIPQSILLRADEVIE
jgi:putative ABC transport system substrate-binding protein